MSDPIREIAAHAQWSLAKSRSRREAEEIARRRKERVRRQERLVWLITALMFAFIALALFCGPASNL